MEGMLHLFLVLLLRTLSSALNLHLDQSYQHCSVDLLDFTRDSSGSGLAEKFIHSNPQHLLWTVRNTANASIGTQLYEPYKYKEKCSISLMFQASFVFLKSNSLIHTLSARSQNPKSIFIFVTLQPQKQYHFKNNIPLSTQAKVFIIALQEEYGISSLYIPFYLSYIKDFKISNPTKKSKSSYNLKYLEHQWNSLNPVSILIHLTV